MYTIGQVEEITGVKQHVLRYWEEVIPGFAPQKDFGGRRTYTEKDIEKILRLRYLIYEKKFTIEGARDQIINEAPLFTDNKNALAEIQKIRAELMESFFAIKKYRNKESDQSEK